MQIQILCGEIPIHERSEFHHVEIWPEICVNIGSILTELGKLDEEDLICQYFKELVNYTYGHFIT